MSLEPDESRVPRTIFIVLHRENHEITYDVHIEMQKPVVCLTLPSRDAQLRTWNLDRKVVRETNMDIHLFLPKFCVHAIYTYASRYL